MLRKSLFFVYDCEEIVFKVLVLTFDLSLFGFIMNRRCPNYRYLATVVIIFCTNGLYRQKFTKNTSYPSSIQGQIPQNRISNKPEIKYIKFELAIGKHWSSV